MPLWNTGLVTASVEEIPMTVKHSLFIAGAWAVPLAACAGQTQTYTMNPGQQVAMPKARSPAGRPWADTDH